MMRVFLCFWDFLDFFDIYDIFHFSDYPNILFVLYSAKSVHEFIKKKKEDLLIASAKNAIAYSLRQKLLIASAKKYSLRQKRNCL